ncbi:hypothetical protein BDR04DRAFT_809238 [Suillus decipiens]|nr:hypothetical protein BDR04DRAFT_809238 [Suillus decipiens]
MEGKYLTCGCLPASHLILSSASSAFSNGETNLEIIHLNEISSLHYTASSSFSERSLSSLSPTEGVQVIYIQARI